MTKRLKYEKPSMKVVLLTQRSMLLAGSPLGNPDNYPGGAIRLTSNSPSVQPFNRKKTMKTTKIFLMAALALTFAACSSDDKDIQNPAQTAKGEGITITATLAPKDAGATTRAVSEGTDEIVVEWAVDEHIAILYDKDGAQMADATIKSVDSETKAATIEFSVETGTADNTACTLVYPYSAAKDDKSGVKDAATLLATQDGTLSANLDVRVGAGTIKTSTPSLDVTTQPAAQFAIFKFTLEGPSIDATHPLVIKDNSNKTITTITPASTATSVYVAMPAAASTTYKFIVDTDDNKYLKSGTATIVAGNYYQTTLTMTGRYPLAMASATADDLGSLLASDGKIYATGAAATAASTTAIGVIAYLGTDNFTENGTNVGGSPFVGHGLVLCLKNAASAIAWSTESVSKFLGQEVTNVDGLKRTTNVSGYTNTATLTTDEEIAAKYPAAKAAKNYTGLTAPAGTTGWFLPSAQQWVKMIEGLGGLTDGAPLWTSWFDTSHKGADKWKAALSKAGPGNYDSMTSADRYYWSSSEQNGSAAVYLRLDARRTGDGYGFYWGDRGKLIAENLVRPVLAF